LQEGDETTNIGWRTIEKVYEWMIDEQRQFSEVDRAGKMYYLKHSLGNNFKRIQM
jgi:hypothetical protein